MMIRSAEFSPCGDYRYTLTRTWRPGPRVCWILLNPSTADAEHDDPTNVRGINFSKRWNYGTCVFVNLFAYRATKPRKMYAAAEPVGELNDSFILIEAKRADLVVVGWGNGGGHRRRDVAVLDLITCAGVKPFHLGMTKQRQPRHPLFLLKTTALVPW